MIPVDILALTFNPFQVEVLLFLGVEVVAALLLGKGLFENHVMLFYPPVACCDVWSHTPFETVVPYEPPSSHC